MEQTTDEYTLSDNKQDGVSYSHVYYDKNKKQQTVSDSKADSAFVVNKDGFDGGKFTYELGKNQNIAQLNKSSENDQFYSAMVTCNMWIEGEDAEARLALVNGKFKVNLVLTKES